MALLVWDLLTFQAHSGLFTSIIWGENFESIYEARRDPNYANHQIISRHRIRQSVSFDVILDILDDVYIIVLIVSQSI